jgi:hypothetical protein
MAQGVTLEFTNLDRFRQALAAYQGDTVRAAAGALFREGERIMTKCKQVYVPVDFGTLRSTGRVQPPVVSGTTITVTLGFGGPAAPYALIVHENLEAYHRPPTQAKYLEVAINEAVAGMDARLAGDIH